MKEIIRYEADDGSIWLTRDEATDRDVLNVIIQSGLSLLNPTPGPTFEGYILQNLGNVNHVYLVALKLSQEEYSGGRLERFESIPFTQGVAAARYITENSPIHKLWTRLQCIDALGREFEQPYFVHNQDKFTPVEYKGNKS